MDRRRLLQYGAIAGAAALAPGVRPEAARATPGASFADVAHRVLMGLPAGGRTTAAVTPSRPVRTGAFSAVSFELPEGAAGLHVRTGTARGWAPWTWLPAADDHAPDPGGPEPLGRPPRVSELLWTSSADHLQVATVGGLSPERVRVHLVDTLQGPVDEVTGMVEAALGRLFGLFTSEPDGPPRPDIVRRADWGADESWRRGSPRHATPERAIVHHTATTNHYRRDEVPAMVRSIYHYHARVRGWNDIGYNFLVDRFGRVFEGRYGGIDTGVVGAHARGHNTGSIGVAVLGDHRDTGASREARDAVAALLAWKYHVHEVPSDPAHRVRHDGRTYPATCGHRDAGRTSCPGARLYERLPSIRRELHRRS